MVNSILITPETQGDRGTRGGFGLPGIKGVKGMKGDMGEKGMMGDEGLNGTRGRAGKCSPRFMCLWIVLYCQRPFVVVYSENTLFTNTRYAQTLCRRTAMYLDNLASQNFKDCVVAVFR